MGLLLSNERECFTLYNNLLHHREVVWVYEGPLEGITVLT